jgi:hypothetical protein
MIILKLIIGSDCQRYDRYVDKMYKMTGMIMV